MVSLQQSYTHSQSTIPSSRDSLNSPLRVFPVTACVIVNVCILWRGRDERRLHHNRISACSTRAHLDPGPCFVNSSLHLRAWLFFHFLQIACSSFFSLSLFAARDCTGCSPCERRSVFTSNSPAGMQGGIQRIPVVTVFISLFTVQCRQNMHTSQSLVVQVGSCTKWNSKKSFWIHLFLPSLPILTLKLGLNSIAKLMKY